MAALTLRNLVPLQVTSQQEFVFTALHSSKFCVMLYLFFKAGMTVSIMNRSRVMDMFFPAGTKKDVRAAMWP